MQIQFSCILGIIAILIASCSSAPKKNSSSSGQKGSYRSSAYHDGNKPPKQFEPPLNFDHKNGAIDDLYLRTQADYHFTMAEAYSLEGFPEKAIEEFKLTLVYDPKSSHVRMRLGAEYLKKGLISEALEELEHSTRLDPSIVNARMLLGSLYGTLKMYEKAESQYRKVIQTNPKNSEALLHLGILFAEERKFDESLKTLSEMAKANKKDAHVAHFYKAKVRLENKQQEKAQDELHKAISIKPKFEEAVLMLGQIYEDLNQRKKMHNLFVSYQDKHGPSVKIADHLARIFHEEEKYGKAFEQYEIMEEVQPNNLNIKVKLAMILIEQKKYLKATMKLKQILAQEPDSDRIRFYLGAVYEEMKDYERAIEQFSNIPLMSSFYGEAVIHTAYLHKLRGDITRAVDAVEVGIKNKNDFENFYPLYASLLHDQKNYPKAIKMLEGAVKKFEQNEQLLFFLGSMYDKVGESNKTILNMKAVIALNPKHSQALNYLAYTYAEQGVQLKEAERLAREAMSINPDDAYIQDTLGWVLFRQGRYKEAVQILEIAHKSKSDESIIAEHLGDAYYRYQLPRKAKVLYKKALSFEKDNENAYKIKKKILSVDKALTNKKNRIPASANP